jgi:hypothetical protein
MSSKRTGTFIEMLAARVRQERIQSSVYEKYFFDIFS